MITVPAAKDRIRQLGGTAKALAQEFVGVDISAATMAECGRQVAVCDTTFNPVLIEVAEPERAIEQIATPCDIFLSFYVFELIPGPAGGATDRDSPR